MSSSAQNDVLIVGGGPVGLTMAVELARYGVPVRIVEKNAHATDKSKALVLWSRTLELIDRMGCTAPFLEGKHRCTKINILAGTHELAQVTLDHIASPYPFALMIPQSETERLM